ncbi:GDYXXLXY domain-containing protein [Tumidithrix elongata RA019]|uniref:GDYXXLXY domain-containing protein n=1 Tax=Tumidithrix elongata BACA0141 TaxID=2716417 RepID=A0AAW9PZ42_9CYAN|nr:GDYXXLXY domain-containing protein [Tumidithrix elongata RA019]
MTSIPLSPETSGGNYPEENHPTQQPPKKLKGWRFWVPLALQSLLVISIAIPPLLTEQTGKTVVLQTAPVDPYDVMRGYSQSLSYDISRMDTLKKLPGWKDLPKQAYGDYPQDNTNFYVIMQAPNANGAIAVPPKPWQPIAIKPMTGNSNRGTFRPETLPPSQVAIRGRTKYASVEYGLEIYFMPEELRDRVNQEASQASFNKTSFVEIKVNAEGRAVPIRLWLGNKNYRF